MGSPLMLLHVVGAFEHLVTLRTLTWFCVHVLHSYVPRQINFCDQLVTMRAGFLACKDEALGPAVTTF